MSAALSTASFSRVTTENPRCAVVKMASEWCHWGCAFPYRASLMSKGSSGGVGYRGGGADMMDGDVE